MKVAIIIAAIAVVILVYKYTTARKVMSPEQFCVAVKDRITKVYPNITIESIDGFDWKLIVDGEPRQIYLDNTYARYRHYPDQFDDLIDRFLQMLGTTNAVEITTWLDAKPRLFPCLKSAEYLENYRKMTSGNDLVVMDYREGFKIIFAIDSDDSMAFVSISQLNDWGTSMEELLQISIDNLAKLTAPYWVEATQQAMEHGLFVFSIQDGYDASRILLPDFYERVSRALDYDKLLVGIPTRDFLSAIPQNAPWKNKFHKQIQSDYESFDHPVSPELIPMP